MDLLLFFINLYINIYFKLFIMVNGQHISLFLFISLCLSSVYSQQIVDFTYSQYLQSDSKGSEGPLKIRIKPDYNLLQDYNFPESCYSAKLLSEQKVQPTDILDNFNTDSYIDQLKVEFVELLKISQKIKKKKQNIQELGSMTMRGQNVEIVDPKGIELLKAYEERLALMNSQIEDNTAILESLVYDSIKNSESGQFIESALQFQIQSLNIKLNYLKDLKRNTESKQKGQPSEDYEKYFSELKKKFDEENQLVNDLNSILQNYNEIGILKVKIQNAQGKIEAINLMLDEKEECVKEIQEIKKSQRNEGEIQALMASLREKKKDVNSQNNKYCEGVAKKLEDRVKKLLKIYDYTFECAEGVDELNDKKVAEEKELESFRNRLKELEDSKGIDDYKRKFEENRKYMSEKHKKVSSFKINQYTHNLSEIQRLIEKTEKDLKAAEERRELLPGKKCENQVDYKRIQDLVYQIKKLKGNYCREYDLYEVKAKELWKNVHRFESEMEYESKINGLYEGEINSMRDLEMEFESLRQKLLKKIR